LALNNSIDKDSAPKAIESPLMLTHFYTILPDVIRFESPH